MACQYLPAISGTLTTLTGWGVMTLLHSLPSFQSMQAENRSADKRWGGLGGGKLPAPLLWRAPACLERNAARGTSVSAELSKQQRPLCKTLRMHAQFSISCTSGGGFLISDCLYLQMGHWPFVWWPALRWHLIPAPKTCGHARVHGLPAWGDY